MISTPYNAYRLLIEMGVGHDMAVRLIAMGRPYVSYFLRAMGIECEK